MGFALGLGFILLTAVAVLWHVIDRDLSAAERRVAAVEQRATELENERLRVAALEDAHRKLALVVDNQSRQIRAMARDLGWADDRAHTTVLTARASPPLSETD